MPWACDIYMWYINVKTCNTCCRLHDGRSSFWWFTLKNNTSLYHESQSTVPYVWSIDDLFNKAHLYSIYTCKHYNEFIKCSLGSLQAATAAARLCITSLQQCWSCERMTHDKVWNHKMECMTNKSCTLKWKDYVCVLLLGYTVVQCDSVDMYLWWICNIHVHECQHPVWMQINKFLFPFLQSTVEIQYNEIPWDREILFVISVVNKQYKTKEINSLGPENCLCYIRYFVISDLFISSFHCS